jgi:hypothetical protein
MMGKLVKITEIGDVSHLPAFATSSLFRKHLEGRIFARQRGPSLGAGVTWVFLASSCGQFVCTGARKVGALTKRR